MFWYFHMVAYYRLVKKIEYDILNSMTTMKPNNIHYSHIYSSASLNLCNQKCVVHTHILGVALHSATSFFCNFNIVQYFTYDRIINSLLSYSFFLHRSHSLFCLISPQRSLSLPFTPWHPSVSLPNELPKFNHATLSNLVHSLSFPLV